MAGAVPRISDGAPPDGRKLHFRYLALATTLGLLYSGHSSTTFHGYSDSDWAGCVCTRRSTTSYLFVLAGVAIKWRSRKQTIVAASSCEAEYITIFHAAQGNFWLGRLLVPLHARQYPPTIPLHVNNQGAIFLTSMESIYHRNKPIGIKYHFTRDQLRFDSLRLQ